MPHLTQIGVTSRIQEGPSRSELSRSKPTGAISVTCGERGRESEKRTFSMEDRAPTLDVTPSTLLDETNFSSWPAAEKHLCARRYGNAHFVLFLRYGMFDIRLNDSSRARNE